MKPNTNFKPLRLYVRYQPPIIGIQYKKKQSQTKKRIYTILLQKLILHPDPQQAAKKLYTQHPLYLNQKQIPVIQVANLIRKIQNQLNISNQYEQDDEQFMNREGYERNQLHNQYEYDDDEFQDEGQLNRST